MNIIITMAGLGARFKKIGINIPKHEIIVNNKSLFEWSLVSLKDFLDSRFIFIVREGAYSEIFIKNKCNMLGIQDYQICSIDYLTDGQASTAMIADNYIKDNEAVAIYNIDTYIEANQIRKEDIKADYDGFIPVFKAEGEKWSFIKVDQNNNVIDVVEKKRISELATVGFYYFKSWNIFKNIYHISKEQIKKEFKEVYIAPMYKIMLKQGFKIGYSIINTNAVHVLGTPEDIKKNHRDFM